MRHVPSLALILALASAGAARADDDCESPMSEWQSREAAAAQVESLGISSDRLRIDDGCYEVRGRDSDGNRIELTLDPATLAVTQLEIEFRRGADVGRYLPGAQGVGAAVQPPVANPLLVPGTAPQVSGN